ncbi:MAG: orotidine-5'-phosphate decarboxylase [Balneolaceae bacterium]
MDYSEKLVGAIRESESALCVGLDPNPELIPEELHHKYPDSADLIEAFTLEVMEATAPFCCAYKPNIAFFEALGSRGIAVFEKILRAAPSDKIVIADAKRGDIGSTADQYKKAFFDHFEVDAITLNPLMGLDTFEAWMNEPSRAVYSLALTSNPGSADLLQREMKNGLSFAAYITRLLREKSRTAGTHIGLVIGATHPESLEHILNEFPEASLLIPGVGSQGGSLDELLPVIANHRGIPLITSSRSILYGDRRSKQWKSQIAERAQVMAGKLEPISRKYR